MNVLVVDDGQINLTLFSALLNKMESVTPVAFLNPLFALEWCAENDPDLVLLDYMMPEIDGIEFLTRFRSLKGKENIPVIMVTAVTEKDVRHMGLEASANDFLNKPVDKVEFQARVKNMLALRKAQVQLQNRAEWLAEEVRKATEELVASEHELIFRLSKAAEYRDPETGAHILRMSNYSKLIARNLGLSEAEQELLLTAAPMHDIGKIGIPDQILLKPGRLDDNELKIMRKHAEYGAALLQNSTTLLTQTAEIVAASHHEKFDGSGYPKGLKGDEIPLYGRIVAVADVFDALTSVRPYKKAWPIEDAKQYVIENSGTHFDPKCVEAFLADWDEVLAINARFQDEHA